MLCSGSSDGILSTVIYYLAFIAPICFGILLIVKAENANSSEKSCISLTIGRRGIVITLLSALPIVSITYIISYTTSSLMNLFGLYKQTEFSEPIFIAIILHAILPALFEEFLFRYIPQTLLSENKKTAIIYSSVLFAFAHANLFQLPYAFIAGILFATLNYIAKSIIPSITIHALNNTISLLSIYGYIGKAQNFIFLSLLIISCILIAIGYKRARSEILNSTSGKMIYNKQCIIYSAVLLFLSITNLFA